MKKETTISATNYEATRPVFNVLALRNAIVNSVLNCGSLRFLSRLYSKILGCNVSPRETLYLVHPQLAFYIMVWPVEMPLLVRLLCFFWFAIALYQCSLAFHHKS